MVERGEQLHREEQMAYEQERRHHQSTGSINVARSRLRQKFGLTDSDTSLIAFLDRFKAPQE